MRGVERRASLRFALDRLVAAARACARTAALVSALLCAQAAGLGVRAVSASDYLAERARPLLEASHAETRAVHLGRWMSRHRWNEMLDEALYTLAPKGAWGPEHPAWNDAREALSLALREATVGELGGETGDLIRRALAERYSLEPDQVAAAVAFYRSPGGRVFRDYRVKVLAETAYGLPFVIETEPRETYRRETEAAKQALLGLPDEQTQAVYEFNQSDLGKLLMGIENNVIADTVGNVMRSVMHGVLIANEEKIARAVRGAVPGLPPASEKVYLGTVAMREDRTLDLAIEYHESFRTAGTYRLSYAPGDLHWAEVAGAVPGLAPGETRSLYRDSRGRLSDTP